MRERGAAFEWNKLLARIGNADEAAGLLKNSDFRNPTDYMVLILM
jgi:hypothetical protein